MSLLFVYTDLKKLGITAKRLGHEPEIIVDEAILHNYRTMVEGEEWVSVVPDVRSIVMGQIVNLSHEDFVIIDKFNSEFERQPIQIDEYNLEVYVIKPEYVREEYHCDEIDMDEFEQAEFLGRALKRYTDICDRTDHMRAEFVDDIKFKNGMQWPESSTQERQRDQRPIQTINRIDNFINTVVNQGLQNQPGIKVRPNDSVSDPATAEVVSGLIRHVIHNGDSKTALDTAYDYAVSGGYGFFRVLTEYCDNVSFDQEIRIDRIENPCSVYFPIHVMKTLDYSDAPYAFIRQKMSKDEFKAKYPDKVEKFATVEQQGTGDDRWQDADNVYLAEYFVVEEETSKLYLLPSEPGQPPVFSNTIPNGIKPVQERDIRKKVVRWYLITQFEILDSRKLPGKIIPVFPILGKESIVDGMKHYISLTRYLKEPQKMLNFWYSSFTETIANSTKANWLVEENQIANHKDFWDNANKCLPYLPYKATDSKGNMVPPPSRISPPEVGTAILSGIQYASEFMKDVTGLHDASLGATSNERTGKAIQARANQGALATYHFINSYNRAIRSLGNYLIDIIPIIYDTARAVRVVGEDDTDKVVLINQMHPDIEDNARLYDLTVGSYSVVVTVGPSYDTKRQETQDMMTMLMQTAPQMSMVLMDIFAQISDIPGSDKITARMKKFLNMTYPGLLDENEMGTPEQQLKMQIQQMTGDIQQLMQKSDQDEQVKNQMSEVLKNLQRQLEDKQSEISARLQVQSMKTQVDAYKAQMDLAKEQLKQGTLHKTKAMDAAAKVYSSAQTANTAPESSPENEKDPYYGTANYGANQ